MVINIAVSSVIAADYEDLVEVHLVAFSETESKLLVAALQKSALFFKSNKSTDSTKLQKKQAKLTELAAENLKDLGCQVSNYCTAIFGMEKSTKNICKSGHYVLRTNKNFFLLVHFSLYLSTLYCDILKRFKML